MIFIYQNFLLNDFNQLQLKSEQKAFATRKAMSSLGGASSERK